MSWLCLQEFEVHSWRRACCNPPHVDRPVGVLKNANGGSALSCTRLPLRRLLFLGGIMSILSTCPVCCFVESTNLLQICQTSAPQIYTGSHRPGNFSSCPIVFWHARRLGVSRCWRPSRRSVFWLMCSVPYTKEVFPRISTGPCTGKQGPKARIPRFGVMSAPSPSTPASKHTCTRLFIYKCMYVYVGN